MQTNLAQAQGKRSGTASYIPLAAFVIDALLVAVAIAIAVLGRGGMGIYDFDASTLGGRGLTTATLTIVFLWLVMLAVTGCYSQKVLGAGTDEYREVLNASVLAAAAVGIGCYLLKLGLPRGIFVLAFVVGTVLLLLGRFLLRRTIYGIRARGGLLLRVLILGTGSHIDEIAAVLRRESWLGYEVIGALTPTAVGADAARTHSGVPILGEPGAVVALAETTEADVVFLAGGAVDSAVQLRKMAWDLEDLDVQVVVAPSLTDVSGERVRVRPVGGLPLIHLEKPRLVGASRSAKRVFDVVGALCLMVMFSPVFLYAATRVWVHDRGPVLFRQVRVGREGHDFNCLKFRTMVQRAEDLLAELHEQQGHTTGLFKMQDDPRVTPPGKFLRRFSLDELPQLVNVLRGEMSLVGPRPPLHHEVAQYDEAMARRLRVRPGMTGLWQVSGRSDLSWSEAIRLDLYYVDNWSMVQDMAILFRTFGAVTRRRGAY